MKKNSPNKQELREQAEIVSLELQRRFPGVTIRYPESNWSKKLLPFLYEDIRYTGTSMDFYANGVPQKDLLEEKPP